MDDTPLLTWRARTRPKHERSPVWYLTTGILTGLFLLYSIQIHAVSLTVLIVMCVIVYYFFALRPEPTVKEIGIFDNGIQLDEEFYPWQTLTGFWFQRYPQYTQLHIEHKEAWRYDLIIQAGPVSVANIRSVLAKHLPEHADRMERALDRISRLCKI